MASNKPFKGLKEQVEKQIDEAEEIVLDLRDEREMLETELDELYAIVKMGEEAQERINEILKILKEIEEEEHNTIKELQKWEDASEVVKK